ncbi:MAG: hypothetical protein AUJ75_03765 [Candidatus Omnitrophica bacterium CG1_02_49_10]|nr:MAG: hypothetical protein AUJ75_03765 [Candidatus Omnitrophica bacterium CG1_02_49_10]
MPARIAVKRCRGYEPTALYDAIKEAIGLIGGIKDISPDKKVLIKPNLLSARPPESGVNTHPEFIRAVIRVLKEAGVTPMIGDSHGGAPGRARSQEDVYRISGVADVALEEGVQLIKFDKVRNMGGMPIAQAALEADFIISLPKFKTHSLMKFTGAVKNSYGMVPGVRKAQYHKEFPKPADFAKIIVDVFSIARPHLVIMDGVVAMEGDGPGAGSLRDAGYILAGRDAVALDAVCAFMMGIEPLRIGTIEEAYKRGLGEADLDGIEIVGEDKASIALKDFKLPKTTILDKAPSFILKPALKLINFIVHIENKRCIKCKVCEDTCPVHAITIGEKRSFINQSQCIKCMCCHEVCPYNAINIKRNLFMKLLNMLM